MKTSIAKWGLALSLGASACSSGPKHKVDEAILSDVPIQQKQGMLDAKADIERAAEERRLAQAKLASTNEELRIAKAAREQAKLEVSKDQARLDLAEKRKNTDTIRQVQDRMRVTQLGVTASDARLDWLTQRQKANQSEVDLAKAKEQVADARFELEKAQLAVHEHRQPSNDFRVSQFQQQLTDTERRQQSAELNLQTAREQAGRLEERYAQMAQQYNEQRSQLPEPTPALILPLPPGTMQAGAPKTPPM